MLNINSKIKKISNILNQDANWIYVSNNKLTKDEVETKACEIIDCHANGKPFIWSMTPSNECYNQIIKVLEA